MGEPKQLEPRQPTAVLLVGSYAGVGIHSLLTIQRLFPNYYKNFIFISVGVIDSATFKNIAEVEEVRERTDKALQRYVALAQGLGLAADYRYAIGTEAVNEAVHLCVAVAKDFPRSRFFAGKLIFQEEKWFQRLLHNETAYQLQRRLQFAGLNAMVLPVRVLEHARAKRRERSRPRGAFNPPGRISVVALGHVRQQRRGARSGRPSFCSQWCMRSRIFPAPGGCPRAGKGPPRNGGNPRPKMAPTSPSRALRSTALAQAQDGLVEELQGAARSAISWRSSSFFRSLPPCGSRA